MFVLMYTVLAVSVNTTLVSSRFLIIRNARLCLGVCGLRVRGPHAVVNYQAMADLLILFCFECSTILPLVDYIQGVEFGVW